jgi:hypothetical protein
MKVPSENHGWVVQQKRGVNGKPSTPVFVTGIFRSGTSLLYALLNQHPKLGLMYECDAWDFPNLFSRIRFQNNWLERQEFYNQALSRHRLMFGGRLAGLENTRTPEQLYRTYSDGIQAGIWGEKSACYSARLRQLAREYPDGRMILMWRDPVEIYRSVINAGRTDRFFRRRGILNRMIFNQERMIQQAAELTRAGFRIHHVTYNDLIDKTEDVCRGVCRFLEVDFDERMLDLPSADLSAVYRAPHHDSLRRGVIERQQFSEEIIDPSTLWKLHRFRNRWRRMNQLCFDDGAVLPLTTREPSAAECLYHRLAGSTLRVMDDARRALFEFLPLTWLQTYRQTAQWLFGRNGSARRLSFRQDLSEHWITILSSFLVLAGLITVHYFSDPRFTFLPFYLIPCGTLALVVNRRWATVAAFISAWIGPALLSRADSDFADLGVFVWNCIARFLLLQIVVLLLDRVRIETNSSGSGKVGGQLK